MGVRGFGFSLLGSRIDDGVLYVSVEKTLGAGNFVCLFEEGDGEGVVEWLD